MDNNLRDIDDHRRYNPSTNAHLPVHLYWRRRIHFYGDEPDEGQIHDAGYNSAG